MRITPEVEDRLRRSLRSVAGATVIDIDWETMSQRLEEVELETLPTLRPVDRRHSSVSSRPALVAVLAFAFVLVVFGLVAVQDQPSQPEPADRLVIPVAPSWADWFDQVNTNATPLTGPSDIREGGLGPEPRFDTSALGAEQALTKVGTDLGAFEGVLAGYDDSSVMLAGRIGGVRLIGAAHVPASLDICLLQEMEDGSAAACWDMDELADFGPIGSREEDGFRLPQDLVLLTPAQTSVVVVEAGEVTLWQRPVGGLAAFELRSHGVTATYSDPMVEVSISMYDEAGRLIYHRTHRF